ncbi:MAG: Imm30 family immunity protein [bacterium]
MKLYEQLLNEIKDNEITEEFQEIFETAESNGTFSLEDVEGICRVFTDGVDDCGLFYSMIHAIERTYVNDKNGYLEAIVRGFSLNTNECSEWCTTVLTRVVNAGHGGYLSMLIGELEDDYNFMDVIDRFF